MALFHASRRRCFCACSLVLLGIFFLTAFNFLQPLPQGGTDTAANGSKNSDCQPQKPHRWRILRGSLVGPENQGTHADHQNHHDHSNDHRSDIPNPDKTLLRNLSILSDTISAFQIHAHFQQDYQQGILSDSVAKGFFMIVLLELSRKNS